MPKKLINWELRGDTPVLTAPDRYYYRKGDRVVISDSIDEMPRVSTCKYSSAMIKRIIEEWITANKLRKVGWEVWYPHIEQMVGILELSDTEREEHYAHFRETQLGKIDRTEKTLKRLEKKISKDLNLIKSNKVRLLELDQRITDLVHSEISKALAYYKQLAKWLSPTRKSEHKLLQGRLGPLIEAMEEYGLNLDQQARALSDLLRRFKYSYFKKMEEFPGFQPSRRSEILQSYVNRAEGMIIRSYEHYRRVRQETQK